ncbi:tetratricopeptide repeat protein [Tengunoibacter tsumagoiensis]|uniref:Tetratricopeptide repeat protein n=1 Tax=Tengunoibacter tsumagoiensis TaxID=2014871 RepID=A0A402A8X3_9CHLR|nr:tetratricopeptide repeat protein [Tengunoibacter tsumagoiensis]
MRDFRTSKHISQRILAEKLGVHRNTIGSWEQGNYLPDSKSMVLELARQLKLSDVELRQLLEASLTVLSPHWSVPYQRNAFFTGRETFLDTLHHKLRTDHAMALPQSYALHGLGGIGKTQIALEYAYRYALEYSAVFWIEAETIESTLASMSHIAMHLQLPERGDVDQQRMVAAVQRWLTTNSAWLLIWDNVEDLDLLQRFLPPAYQGAFLITTRNPVLGTLAQSMELPPMMLEEAMAFVLRRARLLQENSSREPHSQVSLWEEEAKALVQVMGGLPLALDQASAYIEESGCSIADYLHHYIDQRTQLLDRRGTFGKDHPHTVTATFSLAYTQVKQHNPLAADLLCLCAWLYAERIPEELFVSDPDHARPALVANRYQLDQMIVTLRTFSLVQRQSDTQTFSLHRLVQVVLQEEMNEPERATWQQRVIHLLNMAFPAVASHTGTELWEPCERLLPHVIISAAAVPDSCQDQELAELLLKAADYLHERSRYKQALSLYQQALQIRERASGLEHPAVASLKSQLAHLYRVLGNYAQAEPLFQSAVHVLEQRFGPKHLEVAYPLEGLAMVYYEQGKYELAEPLQQRALQIREQERGSEHPEVALALNRLGNIYYEQGKYELTERVYQRALQIREQTVGPEHFRIASSLNNLGNLYREQGKYERAEVFCLRAVRVAEQTLGAGHPDLAVMLGSLADLYREWGRYPQAEELYQRALSITEQALDPEHPALAYHLHGLALLCREQGDYEHAEALFQRTLQIREQRLGQDHPETAQTLYDQALFHQLQGQLGKASSLAERALQIRLRSLGNTHPKTIVSRTLAAQLEEKMRCNT